jgi:hypothetical protein
MSDPSVDYSTAKGYVQSAFLIMANPYRFQASNDTTFFLSFHLLLGFSVELYLKAYLRHTGHSEKDLKSFGVRHNLEKLLELSEADGFALPAAKSLVDYLTKQHGNYEYRYPNIDGSYRARSLGELFGELNQLDWYIDSAVGASASHGKAPSTVGWTMPPEFNVWRF